MGFETVVLSAVKDVVNHSLASFEFGTLFIANIDAEEAAQVQMNLRELCTCNVIQSQVGGEFAYDFVK
jgi:hypothetical protein